MSSVLGFLKARLSERSSRIQLGVMLLLVLLMTGLVSMDQIDAWVAKLTGVLMLLGPMAAFLHPDPKAGVDPAAAAAAADALLRAAAERQVGRETARRAVEAAEGLSKAMADAGVDTDALAKRLGA